MFINFSIFLCEGNKHFYWACFWKRFWIEQKDQQWHKSINVLAERIMSPVDLTNSDKTCTREQHKGRYYKASSGEQNVNKLRAKMSSWLVPRWMLGQPCIRYIAVHVGYAVLQNISTPSTVQQLITLGSRSLSLQLRSRYFMRYNWLRCKKLSMHH